MTTVANNLDKNSPVESAVTAPLVVLGTGLAGYTLVKEFRKHDKHTPVILISKDDGRFYSKPMLSTCFTKELCADDLVQHDAETMGDKLNASVRCMTEVVAIDTDDQIITFGKFGEQLHYGQLVLALGSSTGKLPLEGDALDEIHSINDLNDFERFRASVKNLKSKQVSIIGGGLIGCEFANDLLNGGYQVNVIEVSNYCLYGLMPEVACRTVQRALEELGAEFYFDSKVIKVNRNINGSLTIHLDNHNKIDSDIIISAIGVNARIELAKLAGIKTNRGIITDRKLQTSAKNVYALGDCAEVDSHLLTYITPLIVCAKALGKTLSGDVTEVVYHAMPIVIKTPACPIVVNPVAKGIEGRWSIDQKGNDITAEFYGDDGALKGFALTGGAVRKKAQLQLALTPLLV